MPRISKKKPKISLEKDLELKKDFPPSTLDQWKEKAIKDLKGKNFDEELFTDTYEEIKLKPIYTESDLKNNNQVRSFPGFEPYVRGTKAGGYIKKTWDICQEIPAFSAEEFNARLRHDMEAGQTSLLLSPDRAFQLGRDADEASSNDIGRGGISISNLDDFCHASAGIDLQKYPLHINPGLSSS